MLDHDGASWRYWRRLESDRRSTGDIYQVGGTAWRQLA